MKLKLEKLNLDYTQNLQKCINNEEVVKTLNGMKFPFTLNDAKNYIKESLKNKDSYEFAIFFESNFVGTIVLENPNSNKKIFEIGYVISKDYWGKGIATMAVQEILKFACGNLKLKKVWAGIVSNNLASGRVLEKAGFKLEGIQKQQIFQNNTYYDEHLYGFINNSK